MKSIRRIKGGKRGNQRVAGEGRTSVEEAARREDPIPRSPSRPEGAEVQRVPRVPRTMSFWDGPHSY